MEPVRTRYLSAADVTAAMPPVEERLALAERTMTALVADAELPPKIGVHPRPAGSFAHAMPAVPARPGWRRPARHQVGRRLPGEPLERAAGDPRGRGPRTIRRRGVPRAILDGGPITAQRTAAVSGVAMAHFGPQGLGRAPRAAVIGAGVQGHSHLEVLGHVLPGVESRSTTATPIAPTRSRRRPAPRPASRPRPRPRSARDATSEADVVITAASFTDPEHRQAMTADWLTPDALVIPVDYATMCAAEVAEGAALFLVDDRGQFVANREAGQFEGYPDPGATLGEAILAGTPRPGSGRVVVTHLGVGLADVVFADAIVRRAEAAGLGTALGG